MWGDDEGPPDGTVDVSTSGQVMFKPHQPKQRKRQKKATEAGPRKSNLLAVHQSPVHCSIVCETSALCAVPLNGFNCEILPRKQDATEACVFA